MILKTYQTYIIKNYLTTLLKISLIFLSLTMILNVFEEINFFKDSEVSIAIILTLTIINAPSILYEIFPFIFLITSQFFFIKIMDQKELSVYKNFGIENIKILKIIGLSSLIIGIFIATIFYNFSAKLKFLYYNLKNDYSSDNKYLAVITHNGIWIKDEVSNSIYIVNAQKISENFLINVDVSEFDKNFELIRNINAKKIDISNKKWSIKNATTLNKNNEIKENIDLFINSNFDLEKINSLYSNLSSLTIWELYKLKKDYVDLGYSSIGINTQIQKIISFPLYVALMTIIATIVMLNIKPNKSKVFYLVLGIALSVIIFYLSNFINILGKNERLPMILAIWLPLIILSIFNMIGMVRLNEK